jgi:hypothetical protein
MSPLIVVLLMGQARAFDSVCHLPDGAVCEYGYQPPRHRWDGAESEHSVIFADALSRSGLPPRLAEPFTLRTFADDRALIGDVTGAGFDSVAPVRLGADVVVQRTMTIAEFAALPDFSFSLYDWISGNERCDPYASTGDERCHQFKTHMGSINSSHFVPQSQRFYEHYHLLAMDRAAACADLEDQLAAADPTTPDRLESVLLACEQEALVIEAVGQHYLQDAWSMGHMWERWGGPELADHPEGLAAAQVVGATSGLIHGAKGLVSFADDPLCAPHADVAFVDPVSFDEVLGAGDLFWDSFLADGAVAAHREQTAALLGCTINGMREVYEQTRQRHGVLLPAEAGLADLSRDPLGTSCWGQRATHEALATGFNLHTGGTAPNSTAPLPGAAFALLIGSAVPLTGLLPGSEALSLPQVDRYRGDILLNYALIQFAALTDPNGVALASGGLFPLLGAEPNGVYARGGLLDGGLPASYADPALPWGLPDGDEPVELLHLGFATAHSADRCADVDGDELDDLRAVSLAAVGTPSAAAACGLCSQLAAPFVRIGAGPSDYDAAREPICGYLRPSADFAYVDPWEVPGNTASAAGAWCGCGARLAVTTRGSSPGLALFERLGETLTPLPAGPGTSAGDVLPVADSARAVALGGPLGDWALVAANSGLLSAFELIEGSEVELDWDADPTTTDPGAPAGVTRLALGGGPRQIALTPNAPYAIIPTESGIEFIDVDRMVHLGLIPDADLGLASNERVYGAAVTADDSTAFVSIWGGTSGPATNETLVLDLTGLLAGDSPDAGWITASISTGGGSNNQRLEVSHGGDQLAIVCPDTDRVLVVETAPPYDRVGFYIESSTFEPSEVPADVAWAPDDSAIYVGYIGGPLSSTIGTSGTVRRCDIDQPDNCQHAVAVQSSVRSLDVAGSGSGLVVWVADGNGGLTALPAALFEPGAGTSGIDGSGLFDGTGGCLGPTGRAVPCAATAQLGQAAGDLLLWGD